MTFPATRVWTSNRLGYREVRIDGTVSERWWYARRVKDTDAITVLANDPHPMVREAAAGNAKCHAAVRDGLFDDVNPYVRLAVARWSRNESVLTILAQDPCWIVRRAMVVEDDFGRHSSRPLPDSVRALLTDIDVNVYSKEFSENCSLSRDLAVSSTNPNVLTKLAHHPSRLVRAHVARNTFTPVDVVTGSLLHDLDPDVLDAVIDRLGLEGVVPFLTGVEPLLPALYQRVRSAGVSFEPFVSAFRFCPHSDVRGAVAEFLTDPVEIADYLADPDPEIRAKLAGNPNLSVAEQRQLLMDPVNWVAVAACAGKLDPVVANEEFSRCSPLNYGRMSALITQPSVDLEKRLAVAVKSTSRRVRDGFVDSLTPEQAVEVSQMSEAAAKLVSRRMLEHVMAG